MKHSGGKLVKYRYQDTIFETINDLDGKHVVPDNDNVVTLSDGQRYRVVQTNITTGAKNQLPFYDVVVQKLG